MRARLCHATVVACILQLLASSTSAFNIDTRQAILRRLPSSENGQAEALFGFSLVLHQAGGVGISNSKIVVSAPNLTVPNSNVEMTGGVYTCPITMGDCEPLGGDQNNPLFDTGANVVTNGRLTEDKAGQFLGGSMASNGDAFIVCAHRYNRVIEDSNQLVEVPIGRCFSTTDPQLNGFTQHTPCPVGNDNLDQLDSARICEAGASAAIIESNNQLIFGLGAPGYFYLRGAVIRMPLGSNSITRQRSGAGTFRDSYQGYAIVAGNFRSTAEQDFATSVPKHDEYFGRVNIVRGDNLRVVNQENLRGDQFGEYYGFSLLKARFSGNTLDDLLVGAPMYRANATQPETGRVHIYTNSEDGTLTLSHRLEGFASFSRFGYAMANLGDISGDNRDDIAISAPFSRSGNESGTIYIYYSSGNTISRTPQQVIVGSDLSFNGVDLQSLRGFGTSLSSGVDVDGNGFNDLAVGSFVSQDVFMLRTRPLAKVFVNLTADPQNVNLENTSCTLGAMNFVCFDVRACLTYSGDGLTDMIDFDTSVLGDANNVERRITFTQLDNFEVTEMRTLSRGVESCTNLRAYILNDINDIFNAFMVDFTVALSNPGTIPTSNGNPSSLVNLQDFPVISTTGVSSVQVGTLNECNGQPCVPDLLIIIDRYTAVMSDGSMDSSMERSQLIILGAVRNTIIDTVITNRGQDAFSTSITITVPEGRLEVVRLTAMLNTNNPFTFCRTGERNIVTENGVTSITCFILSRLLLTDTLRISTTFAPSSSLQGNEGTLEIGFRVSTINVEALDTINDGSNLATATVMIDAAANITLDPQGVVSQESISYSDNPANGTIQNVTQLGPRFTTSFVVRNSGPSDVSTISLVINWPLQPPNANETYLLYPLEVGPSSNSGPRVTCMNNINPAGFALDVVQETEGGAGGGNTGGRKKRRKRRSARSLAQRPKLLKRQADMTSSEIVTTLNRTLGCEGTGAEEIIDCVPINCNIEGLQGGSNVQVDVTVYLDERFFANSVDRFNISPTAQVMVVNADFIEQTDEGKTAQATIRLIPAVGPVTTERRPVPWWVIFLPILAAVIIIAVIGAALWGLGFFKRRKHEELKQRKEELENLDNNASGPGASSSTDNLTED